MSTEEEKAKVTRAALGHPTFTVSDQATVILHPDERPVLNDSGDVHQMVLDIAEENQEHLILLALDAAGHLISKSTIGIGSNTVTAADPRDVFRRALLVGAHTIALAHNHPNNDLRPSDPDIQTTARMIFAGRLIGINLVEHLIIGTSGYTSIMRYLRENPDRMPDLDDVLPGDKTGKKPGRPAGKPVPDTRPGGKLLDPAEILRKLQEATKQ